MPSLGTLPDALKLERGSACGWKNRPSLSLVPPHHKISWRQEVFLAILYKHGPIIFCFTWLQQPYGCLSWFKITIYFFSRNTSLLICPVPAH